MSNFRPIDRQTGFLLPSSVDEWLPEKHLARFVVEVIDGLDLRVMRGSYRGSGSASESVCRRQALISWFTRRIKRRDRMEMKAISMKATRCSSVRSKMVFNRR
jgi:hypothetical protein